MSEPRRLQVLLAGRVQGVGFRFFAVEQARRRGLTGWVRNRAGGQVEVLAEGAEEDLLDFLAALREGPPLAWIRSLAADWAPAAGEFARFEVLPSTY